MYPNVSHNSSIFLMQQKPQKSPLDEANVQKVNGDTGFVCGDNIIGTNLVSHFKTHRTHYTSDALIY